MTRFLDIALVTGKLVVLFSFMKPLSLICTYSSPITRLTQLIYNINRIFSTFNTSARGGVVVTLKNRLCMTCGGAAGFTLYVCFDGCRGDE